MCLSANMIPLNDKFPYQKYHRGYTPFQTGPHVIGTTSRKSAAAGASVAGQISQLSM